MGYLKNNTITIDAVLTNKGRELLAKGQSEFQITQYALSDEGVNYDLYDTTASGGTKDYGKYIEETPMLEAVTDAANTMKYKLITLPRKTIRIPVIQLGITSINLTRAGQTITITPSTVNLTDGNTTLGYTAILGNSDIATLSIAQEANGAISPSTSTYIADNESAQTVSAVGLSFTITAKANLLSDKQTTLTIIGNETGGSVTIPVTVKQTTLATINASDLTITNNNNSRLTTTALDRLTTPQTL